MKKRNYFLRVGDWLSQGLNTILFNGEPDESTSGRSYRQQWKIRKAIIDGLFRPFEKDHCKKAYERDLVRAQGRIDRAETQDMV